MAEQRKRLSIVVPAKNEEGNITRLHQEISALRSTLTDFDFEVLAIDNCSSDQTGRLLREVCAGDNDWHYLRFSRDFGSEASIAAGLHYATGDAVVVVFSDLQDPPSEIPNLVSKWLGGAAIVYGIYGGSNHESLWKRFLVGIYYRLLSNLSEIRMVPFAGDFRLYDRKVVDIINTLNERNRYLRGLAQWVGFRSDFIHYRRRPRTSGKSKAPFFYLLSFAFSVIVNFSDKPLRMFTATGLAVMLASFLALMLKIVSFWFLPVIPGLTTTHVLLLFNIAFTALGLGVLGEYISKIYKETKNRPLWIVEESIGIDCAGGKGLGY